VPEATEGKSRTPRLGAGTAWKQTRHHPELEHRTYALAQNIPNEGELFGARAERRFVAFLGIDAKLWRAVFKIASGRDVPGRPSQGQGAECRGSEARPHTIGSGCRVKLAPRGPPTPALARRHEALANDSGAIRRTTDRRF